MLHPILLAGTASSPAGISSAETIFAILASAVIVLGGLAALVRAIWKTASVMRDNTLATKNLTGRMDNLVTSVDGRFDMLARRVETLEGQLGEAQKNIKERL